MPFALLASLGATIAKTESFDLFISLVLAAVTGFALIAQNGTMNEQQVAKSKPHALNTINIGEMVIFCMLIFAGYKIASLGLANYNTFSAVSLAFLQYSQDSLWLYGS